MAHGTASGYLDEAAAGYADHMHLAVQAKRRGDDAEQWRHRALASLCLLAAAEQYLDSTPDPDPTVLRTLFRSRGWGR